MKNENNLLIFEARLKDQIILPGVFRAVVKIICDVILRWEKCFEPPALSITFIINGVYNPIKDDNLILKINFAQSLYIKSLLLTIFEYFFLKFYFKI